MHIQHYKLASETRKKHARAARARCLLLDSFDASSEPPITVGKRIHSHHVTHGWTTGASLKATAKEQYAGTSSLIVEAPR